MGFNKLHTFCAAMGLFLACGPLQAQPLLGDSLSPAERSTLDRLSDERGSMTPFQIGQIYISGNKKTKPYIILRELPFSEGDSVNLSQLVSGFEVARQQLMNTALFIDAVISLRSFRGYSVDVQIDVKERWYILPLPYFKKVDRNLAQWQDEQFSFDRVKYGFKFDHNNFSGRNDKLRIWLITGYSREIQIQYDQPYADPSLKHGFKVGFQYSFTREVNYKTIGNKQVFSDTLGGIGRYYAFAEYLYRPGLRTFNSLRLAWVQESIGPKLLQPGNNPDYFNYNKTRISYPELTYRLNYYKVDYIPYPLTGWMGELGFMKRGINKEMNMWEWSGKYTASWNVYPRMYYFLQFLCQFRAPSQQPFVNQRLLGYGDYNLSGLDRYVVDGVSCGILRQSVKRELLKVNVPSGFKSREHAIIPMRFYAKLFADLGYTRNPNNYQNSLGNSWLYTAGAGIDMVSIYDFVLRLDYAFNQLGENGLFLRIKSEF